MKRMKLPAHAGRRKMIKAVHAEYARLQKELAPALRALPTQDLRDINVAQNVLRDCLSALFDAMIPYPHETAIEIARRAASYALSVVPLEDQDHVLAAMLDGFADFHVERTARGVVISTEWRMTDGSDKPNFPEKE